jgi:putative oxidoreductase
MAHIIFLPFNELSSVTDTHSVEDDIMTDWLQFLARFLIAQIFLGAGILKLLNTAEITQQIATRVSGPLIPLFLIGAIAVELLGGVALIAGLGTR